MEVFISDKFTMHLCENVKEAVNNFPEIWESINRNTTWGLNVPETGWYWSARAIYNAHSIDLLPDRTESQDIDLSGREEEIVDSLVLALTALENAVSFWCVGNDSANYIVLQGGGITMLATPNQSYGYLYISAF